MDVNARINWKPGMEITEQTFLAMDANLDFRQRLALRAALGSNRMGLLPDAAFNNEGAFVKNKFEMEHFRCLAVMPSGRILDAEDSVSIAVPMLYGSVYYLTAGFSDTQVEFEREGVPHLRPQYDYAIHSLEEVEQGDLLPVVRFKVDNGVFTIDSDFIPPCLMLTGNARFKTYIDAYVERLRALSSHPNLEDGEGKRALLRYMFRLKGYGIQNPVADFVLLVQEIVQAIDFYIATPHLEHPVPVEHPSQCDVQRWLQWVDDYMAGAMSILDTVVLEDNTIDYDALLAQAKQELYDQLNPELYARLLASIKDELRGELTTHLEGVFGKYINETLRNELYQTLKQELGKQLYEDLYTELFEHLFNALFLPEQSEKEYVPLI